MVKKIYNLLFKRKNYKFIIGIFLGIFFSIVGVYAASKYTSKSVYYNNENSSLSSDDVQGAIDELSEKAKNLSSSGCPSGYACLEKKTTLALGDYVKMTPTKSSYTTDKSKTGYTSTQTIKPQELNLWRVIKINSDGTVEMISEHVSSTAIYFGGKTGYLNLVGYLNVLASQYENSTYTKGSRHFGYNGQTEYITDTTKFVNPAPWTSSTGSSTVERQGGGDTLYTTDYNLVYTVLGTRVATKPGSAAGSYYWMASRYYGYSSSTSYYWRGRSVSTSGSNSNYSLYRYYSSSFNADYNSNSFRPIVVLKSGLKYYGVGTEDYPMEISVS
ncbi:MAG: hypothetical protein PUD25_04580 [Bacilli bacterium]|nr:hypothetical protein [Bacilli bacterium]